MGFGGTGVFDDQGPDPQVGHVRVLREARAGSTTTARRNPARLARTPMVTTRPPEAANKRSSEISTRIGNSGPSSTDSTPPSGAASTATMIAWHGQTGQDRAGRTPTALNWSAVRSEPTCESSGPIIPADPQQKGPSGSHRLAGPRERAQVIDGAGPVHQVKPAGRALRAADHADQGDHRDCRRTAASGRQTVRNTLACPGQCGRSCTRPTICRVATAHLRWFRWASSWCPTPRLMGFEGAAALLHRRHAGPAPPRKTLDTTGGAADGCGGAAVHQRHGHRDART